MTESSQITSPLSNGRPSGKLVVLGMVAFAVSLMVVMAGYWELHTRPFRALQVAINKEFPDCGPRVIGGRHRSGSHGEPSTLRVLIYVKSSDFNPEEDSPRRLQVVHRLVELSMQYQDLSQYEILEIRLMQQLPEQKWRRWDVAKSPAEWQAELASAGSPGNH